MADQILTQTDQELQDDLDNVEASGLTGAGLLFTLADPNLLGGDADGAMGISASTSRNAGGNIILYGPAHATKAGDIELRNTTSIKAAWDQSATQWDFQANAILTTGTLGAGATTLSGNLVVGDAFSATIGSASPLSVGSAAPKLQVLGTEDADTRQVIARFSANSTEPRINLLKSRDASIGSNTIIVSGDGLGSIIFYGDDGVDYNTAGVQIRVVSEGTIAANRVGAKLELRTGTDAGPTVLTTGLTIDSAQLVTAAAGFTVGAGVLTLPNGSAGTPTLTFVGDLTTGIYQSATDAIGISNAGIRTVEIGAANTVGIGVSADANITAKVRGAGTDTPFSVLNSSGTSMVATGTADLTAGTAGESVTDTMLIVRKDGTTGRSINAVGTVNASGADYAEYERLVQHIIDRVQEGGLGIAKGDVIGFDVNGHVTDRFSESVTFGIKSTDPSYVGGDTWSADVGAKPIEPKYQAPRYVGSQEPRPLYDEPVLEVIEPVDPGDAPEASTLKLDGETDESYAIRQKAEGEASGIWAMSVVLYNRDVPTYNAAAVRHEIQHDAWMAAREVYDPIRAQFDEDVAAYAVVCEDLREAVEAAHPEWVKNLADFKERLEAARICVDRIAYSGKVPVNGIDANSAPGSYLIPQLGPDDSITVRVDAKPAQVEYRISVGRIRTCDSDGNCVVDVLRT